MNITFFIGLALFILGIIICIIGVLWNIIKSFKTKGRIRGGGVVIIGPFPIIYGTDKEFTKMALIMTIIFFIFAFLTFLLPLILGGGK